MRKEKKEDDTNDNFDILDTEIVIFISMSKLLEFLYDFIGRSV